MASNSQAKWSTLIAWFLVGILQYRPLPWKTVCFCIFTLSQEIQVKRKRKSFQNVEFSLFTQQYNNSCSKQNYLLDDQR